MLYYGASLLHEDEHSLTHVLSWLPAADDKTLKRIVSYGFNLSSVVFALLLNQAERMSPETLQLYVTDARRRPPHISEKATRIAAELAPPLLSR